MRCQCKYLLGNARFVLIILFVLLEAGCASRPLVPDATRGKTFAVYPASIALTLQEKKSLNMDSLLEVLKDVSTVVIPAVATRGYLVITPKSLSEPGQKVAGMNLGPPIMREFAVRFEQGFGMRKVADITPQNSAKATGGQLTKSEVTADYQAVADYLVQFDHASNFAVGAYRLFYEAFTDNYFIRYLVTANIYDAKTGERLDWAVCSGEHGSATLTDWFKDNGKLLESGTQEVATKCADEMIRKLNKVTKS